MVGSDTVSGEMSLIPSKTTAFNAHSLVRTWLSFSKLRTRSNGAASKTPSQLDNRTRDALPHSSHAKHRLAGVKRSGSSYQWSGIENG
ncbi:hypothetical protein PAMC26577_15200 [Caballeronia sordidicola]|uniref:Uncharacterized protein n=1 Tax=Caballeronia sordidicola TaxID=196367 RepID=A0A242MTD8_CABSO|nr:hypothetical protein PAMC26577_15200 [Caballeronia sordidicola]